MCRHLVRSSALALTVAVATAGCASPGGPSLGTSRGACRLVTLTLGSLSGVVLANQGEGETDEKLVGGGLGALAGAALGTWLCGEGGDVSIHTAQILANPRNGEIPLEVSMVGQLSPPDTQARYAWDFGDGSHAEGSRVRHTYTTAKPFDVLLTVTDARGRTSMASMRIDAQSALPEVSQESDVPTQRKIILRGVHFAFDSSTVTPAEADVLDLAVEELRSSPEARARIEGGTDSIGSQLYNQDLSERRAEAVLAHLVAQGIDPGRLEASGLGEMNPLASNETADGRAQNRRVELDLID
jgi:OOP family OmpA-OmpF porin